LSIEYKFVGKPRNPPKPVEEVKKPVVEEKKEPPKPAPVPEKKPEP
jgi:hypothetical protein